MKAVAVIDDIHRWVKTGRDGKNRYCIYYYGIERNVLKRCVIAGGLTKAAAYGMLKLLGEG
jgi:hypothetical protein